MKKLLLFCFLLCGLQSAFGQTNTFPTSGPVGIGTLKPEALLHIRGGATRERLQLQSDGNGSAYFDLQFNAIDNSVFTSGKAYSWLLSHRKDGYFSGSQTGGTSLEFYAPRIGGGYFAPLSFTSTGDVVLVSSKNAVGGNVGIGTTAPQAKLHVNGDIYGETGLRFTNNSTISKGIVWGSTGWSNYYSRIDNYEGQLRVMTDDFFYLTDIDQSTGVPGNVTLYANTNSGTVGIGTISPDTRGKLEVKGHVTIDGGNLYTGAGSTELNRYLNLLNSIGLGSASGLKAGGVLVSDSYSYANPGKNDLVVKGAVAIGTASAASKLHVVDGSGVLRTNDNGDGLVLTSYDAAKSIGLSASGNGNYGGTGSVGLKLVNGDISYYANGSLTTVFKNNGSVGIGTGEPGNVLEIKKTPLSNKSHLEFGSPSAVSGTASSLMTFAGWGIQHAGFAWVPNSDLTQGKLHIAFGGLDDASQNSTKVTFQSNGFVGIGTTNPSVMLAVNGDIKAKKVNVTLEGWSDFVFEEDYTLRPLSEVEQFIKTHKHLPDVPSEAEVLEKGVELGEMNSLLLQKIEELTLYQIEQEKIIKKQEERLGEQEQQIKEKDAKMGQFQKCLEQIELRLNNLE